MEHHFTLKPFQVPNFALAMMPPGARQDGFKEAPSFPLADLSVETLDGLCKQFRADVFAKAGKLDPAKLP